MIKKTKFDIVLSIVINLITGFFWLLYFFTWIIKGIVNIIFWIVVGQTIFKMLTSSNTSGKASQGLPDAE